MVSIQKIINVSSDPLMVPSTLIRHRVDFSCQSSLQITASKGCLQTFKDWISRLWTFIKGLCGTKKAQLVNTSIVNLQQRPTLQPVADPLPILHPIAEPRVVPPRPVEQAAPPRTVEQIERLDFLESIVETEIESIQRIQEKFRDLCDKLDTLHTNIVTNSETIQENIESESAVHERVDILSRRSLAFSYIHELEREMADLLRFYNSARDTFQELEAELQGEADGERLARLRATFNQANIGINLWEYAGVLNSFIDGLRQNSKAALEGIPNNVWGRLQAGGVYREIENEIHLADELMNEAFNLRGDENHVLDHAEIEQMQRICQNLENKKNKIAGFDRDISGLWVSADRTVHAYNDPDERHQLNGPPIRPQVPIPEEDPEPLEGPNVQQYETAIAKALAVAERREKQKELLDDIMEDAAIAKALYEQALGEELDIYDRERLKIFLHGLVHRTRFLMPKIFENYEKMNEEFEDVFWNSLQGVAPELRNARWEVAFNETLQNTQDIYLFNIKALLPFLTIYQQSILLTDKMLEVDFQREGEIATQISHIQRLINRCEVNIQEAMQERNANNREGLDQLCFRMYNLEYEADLESRDCEEAWIAVVTQEE